mgnify:CR=1 FL=1
MLEKRTNKKIELRCKVNEDLIAGIRIKINDDILDNSAAAHLSRMKEMLQQPEHYTERHFRSECISCAFRSECQGEEVKKEAEQKKNLHLIAILYWNLNLTRMLQTVFRSLNAGSVKFLLKVLPVNNTLVFSKTLLMQF